MQRAPLAFVLPIAAALAAPGCAERLPPPVTTASRLRVEELALGSGDAAATGCYVAFACSGRLADGKIFDERSRADPVVAKLGTTKLVTGLEEGLVGMKAGGRRRLTLPPELGYGAIGKGDVPPGATLTFEVELVSLFSRTPSGLQYRVLADASGARPRPDQTVVVKYREWLIDTGRELDSSRKRGDPLEFRIADHVALPGLEEAIALMPAGAKWQVALPPELAYGPAGQPPQLLPGVDVLLDLELVGARQH